jgi:tRNA dimethylallyltransferase
LAKLPPAILLMGPTASGKTWLALALARELPMEIVSVDSAQIYRGMDVGTAKPSRAERAAVPHHLLDIIDPTETYSAARFRSDAVRLMSEITGRGKVPLLVGGTMLYFKALREGLSELPDADEGVRAEIDAEAAARGWPAMHARLASVDPQTAARLKPTDAQRIQRALEVYRVSGQPMSGLIGRKRPDLLPFRIIELALVPSDRGALHQRIEERFEAMLERGLLEELRALRSAHALRPNLPSMRCVGYRQAWQYIEGEIGANELRDRGIFATRQLAKRQLTWLRRIEFARAFDCLSQDLDIQVLAYLADRIAQARAPAATAARGPR